MSNDNERELKKLYVGNLPFELKKEEFEELFAGFGEIEYCFVTKKGYGFVEFKSNKSADKAKEALMGTDFQGRNLYIDHARPKRKDDERN